MPSSQLFNTVDRVQLVTETGIVGFETVNILGNSHEIRVHRNPLGASTLTATVFDADVIDDDMIQGTKDLDPATSSVLRPGRKVWLQFWPETTGTPDWIDLFVGKIAPDGVSSSYLFDPISHSMRPAITVVAVSTAATLANVSRPDGVASLDDLRAVLSVPGTAGSQVIVPFDVDGTTFGKDETTVATVAVTDQATALDQVVIVRDTNLGYAWVDRSGVLKVRSNDNMVTAPAEIFGSGAVTDIAVGYTTDNLINSIIVNYLHLDPATGDTSTIPYGPYRDETSIADYGEHSATFTIQGITETEANISAYADSILAANATPQVRATSVKVVVADPSDLTDGSVGGVGKVDLDLYDLLQMTVVDPNSGAFLFNQNSRIVGIDHEISSTPQVWKITYTFTDDGTFAAPTVVPVAPRAVTPPPNAWIALPLANGWVNFGGANQVAQYRKDGDRVELRGMVKSGVIGPTPVCTLPAGFRPLANIFFPVASANAFGQVEVDSTGTVKATQGSAAWVSFAGITYATT